MVISLFGLPASGKSSLAQLLSEHLNIPLFSLGQRIRDEIQSQSSIGQVMKSQIQNQGVLDSELASRTVIDELLTKQSMILDGFPRNLEQVKTFKKMSSIFIDVFIYLECPEEEIRKRYNKRQHNQVRDDLENLDIRINQFYVSKHDIFAFLETQECEIFKINGSCSKKKVFDETISLI